MKGPEAVSLPSELTQKERVCRALCHEPVDRFPTQCNYTALMGQKLADHFKIPFGDLPARLDNHLLRVDVTHPKRLSEDGRTQFDWWGAGWSTETEGYWHSVAPLAHSTDLGQFPWPDPDAPHLLDGAASSIAAHRQLFAVPNLGMCLFERAWSLRGFDTLLMDMVEMPDWVEHMFDRITDIQVRLAKHFVEIGVNGGYFGDDYGAQQSMLFSPPLWRRLVKPRLARMIAVFRDAGLPVIFHSDGDIRAILRDLVEIGVTVLNPVQPEVLDHAWLSRQFGASLGFYGGISTQTILSQNDSVAVRRATAECARQLAPSGTGLLLGPSHRMQSDIPPANVEAMLEAFRQLGV
jgi:uroporphyrinogen decarboxylase